MASAFLKAMGLDGNLGEIVWGALSDKSSSTSGHEVRSCSGGHVKIRSSKLPFCAGEGGATDDNSMRAGMSLVPFDKAFNRLTLRITSPKAKFYQIAWGSESKRYNAEELTAGVAFASDFINHPLLSAFQAVWNAVSEKQTYETRQIKTLAHGPEGATDPDATFALTEKKRAPLAAKVKDSLKPVEHEIVIMPLD